MVKGGESQYYLGFKQDCQLKHGLQQWLDWKHRGELNKDESEVVTAAGFPILRPNSPLPCQPNELPISRNIVYSLSLVLTGVSNEWG